MIEAIGSAALLGVILSFSLGPIFFELINTSLRKGFKTAMFLEVGVIMSDIIYLLVALFSAEKVLHLIEGNDYFKIIGGSIFIVFGLYSILKNVLKKSEDKKESINKDDVKEIDESILDRDYIENEEEELSKTGLFKRHLGQVVKGITLNAINPSVLLFWIITCSITIKKLEGTGLGVIPFFIITLAVMFAVDLTKIHFASKLKRHMTPKILAIIGVSIGAIMMAAGIIIMFQKIEFNIPSH